MARPAVVLQKLAVNKVFIARLTDEWHNRREGEAGSDALEQYGDKSADLTGGGAHPCRSRGTRHPVAGRVASLRREGAPGPVHGDRLG
jgi:hypothetical protein